MKEKPEAIGYDRVSTDRQASKGVMLEARSESIPEFCAFKKWPLLEYHTDQGRSGREGKRRPGFDAAMEAACKPGRILVVDSLSRFVRSTIDADQALKRLQEAGADIVIINLGIDTTTAAGKLIYKIIAAVAEFESNQIGERVKAANKFIVSKRGFRTMGRQQFGYRLSGRGDSQEIVPDHEEQIILQQMETAIAQFGRTQAAADWLNEKGVSTPAAHRGYRNARKKWDRDLLCRSKAS